MSLLLPIALPLLTAVLIGLCGRLPTLRDGVMLLGGVTTAAVVWWFSGQAETRLALLDFGAGLSLVLASEPLGLLFSLVAGSLWPVTAVYAASYLRQAQAQHQTRFFVCLALSIAAAQLIALAGNLFTLFIGYELLTLATWPLVTHAGTDIARRGGRIYLGYLLPTSVALLLPAIIVVQQVAGSTDFVPGGLLQQQGMGPLATGLLFAVFMLGIGKAALMPVHRWLPAAMVAPAPVSALLHAVAVVKAGVFCVLKVTIYIFGPEFLNLSGAAQPITWLAAFSLIAASLIALNADNLKQRLAYSTVSQLAYVSLAASLANAAALYGGSLQIIMHACGKITLFFCAGAIYAASKASRVSELDGLGRRMPLTFAAFALASLSIIGLPPLGGSWTKWWLLLGALEADALWIVAVLALSTLLNIGYLLPVVARGFLAGDGPWRWGEARWGMVIPLCLTALASLALFFWTPLAAPLARMSGLTP